MYINIQYFFKLIIIHALTGSKYLSCIISTLKIYSFFSNLVFAKELK